MKTWFEGRWWLDPASLAWRYVPPGEYDPALTIRDEEMLHTLQHTVVRQLIKALDEAGWITPRLDERLRAEDLKITHRLLDLLEKK